MLLKLLKVTSSSLRSSSCWWPQRSRRIWYWCLASPEAIRKAVEDATDPDRSSYGWNNNGHPVISEFGGAKVLLKPAVKVLSVGGAVRAVIELAGVADVTSKISLAQILQSTLFAQLLKVWNNWNALEEVMPSVFQFLIWHKKGDKIIQIKLLWLSLQSDAFHHNVNRCSTWTWQIEQLCYYRR